MNIEQFTNELLFTGNIIQDDDNSVEWPERENRFNRYIELLDSLKGNEGLEIARVIIKSMQAEQDYGAYQTTQRTLGKFPSEIYIEAMILELPSLIANNSEWAGELLCGLANSEGTEYEEEIILFKQHLESTVTEAKNSISNYVKEQEKDGWLEHRVGVLI